LISFLISGIRIAEKSAYAINAISQFRYYVECNIMLSELRKPLFFKAFREVYST